MNERSKRRREVFVAGGKLGKGDRRVDVVECRDTACMVLHEGADRDAIRNERADDDRVGFGDIAREGMEIVHIPVENKPAVGGRGKIAVGGVPWPIPFREGDCVTARRQSADDGSERGRVPVAPRRGEAQAEDKDAS